MPSNNRLNILIPAIGLLIAMVVPAVGGQDNHPSLRAYYTKIVSDQPWERFSRTGKYADVVVRCDGLGDLVFWRGSSYLPYWKTDEGRWQFPELVQRKGDGSSEMPDRQNRYSYVRIIKQSADQAVVHWRYMPDFANVSWDGVVDEYFVITSDGQVTRTVRKGTPKIDDWRDPGNVVTQVVRLRADGLKNESETQPSQSKRAARPVAGAPVKNTTAGTPVAHLRFDEGLAGGGDVTREGVADVECEIAGHKSLWKAGVSGTALAFDGYYSAVVLPKSRAPAPSSQLTVEAWVALGAYPFQWAPIVEQSVWGESGYYFGVDRQGRLGFHARIGDAWQSVVDHQSLELRRWYHVAATFDRQSGKTMIFVDGKPRAQQDVPHEDLTLAEGDLTIGLNTQKMPAVEGHMRIGKWPSLIGFDGLIDEVKLYDKALGTEQIAEAYEALRPPADAVEQPDLAPRRFPANPEGKRADRFGARYTRLSYYDTWDNMWRVGEHPDVIVNFDLSPTRFVFWRGLSHGIGLVTENGKWAGDQSSENYKQIGADRAEGCCEHMSDKQCRHSHVRIIENTDARTVVHWRYGMVDSRYIFPDVDPQTGWGDWADEYWTIYPDGVGVRQLERGWIWADSWVETMFYSEPGTMPEDNVELAAYTLVNLNGEKKTYSWESGSPKCDLEAPVISMVNMKSKYRPFNIYPLGSSVKTFGGHGRRSHFHWWNHYPVSQITSDGRSAVAADRAAHSSLVWGNPSTNYLIYGLTDQPPETLLPLARSWNTPPRVLDATGCQAEGYRAEERAYHLRATSAALSFKVFATGERPLVNPCFVVSDWPSRTAQAWLVVNGEEQPAGPDFRQGVVLDTMGRPKLVVWLKLEATEETRFELGVEPLVNQ